MARILVEIPTKNRPRTLAKCLAALAVQSYQDFDVLIINDPLANKPAQDRPIVQEWIDRLSLRHKVTVITGTGCSPPAHHNIPLYDEEFSRYEWILRMDDDILLNRHFLVRLVEATMIESDVGAVAGLYFENESHTDFSDRGIPTAEQWRSHPDLKGDIDESHPPSNWPQRLYHWTREELSSLYKTEHLYSACLYNAQAMREVGGWPTCYSEIVSHGEEADGTYRLHVSGYKLLVVPGATAQHLKAPGGIRTAPHLDWAQVADYQTWLRRLPLLREGKFEEADEIRTSERITVTRQTTKVLVWSDSPFITSGFGLVTKQVLQGFLDDPEIEVAALGRMQYVQPENPGFLYQTTHPSDPDGRQIIGPFAEAFQPDVLWIMYDPGNLVRFLEESMMWAEPLQQWPIIAYFPIEGYAIRDGKKVPGSSAFTYLAQQVTMPVTWTKCGAEALVNDNLGLKGKVQHVGLGFDHAPFEPLDEADRQHLRRIVGIDDRFVIMNACLQKRIKQIPYLMEAIQILVGRGYNDVFLYLHTKARMGHLMDGWDLNDVRRHMGLEKYVMFDPNPSHQYLGVPYHNEEVVEEVLKMQKPPTPQQRGAIFAALPLATRYAMADLYVDVASVEGWCLPLGEAMACGVPGISVDDGFVRREVFGQGAYMVTPYFYDTWRTGSQLALVHPRDVANAIEAMMEDNLRQLYVDAGMKVVNEHTWDNARSFFGKAVRQLPASR